MTKRLAIWAYNTGSRSAHNLAEALEAPIIRHENSKFRGWGVGSWLVINWGSTNCPKAPNVLNPPQAITTMTDKLSAFKTWFSAKNSPRVPPWTQSIEEARRWANSGHGVMCRTKLSSHSGAGIVYAEDPTRIVQAPLYTQYVPKDREYRLHLVKWRKEPIFIQQKVRDPEREPTTWKVRSHDNGFIFQHNNLKEIPSDVLTQAALAFKASSLDFGAVDVVWNSKRREAYVLEINTAPGLEGTTIAVYANAFKDL